jgi:sialic acid synthase SpsE
LRQIRIGNRLVGDGYPTYFVADIAANHDGSLSRALALVRLAHKSGADAVKFQHFRAEKIVSDYGFRSLGAGLSHQARWRESVFSVYQKASIPWEWTETLKSECDRLGIDFFSSPYDMEAVDHLDPFVPAFKIGSGDITWPEILLRIAETGKPVILGTGASSLADVVRAVDIISSRNGQLALLQCNTNYTGSVDNIKHVSLNVITTLRRIYPDYVIGISDHTPGHVTVLGAVALGARIVEKHFTDDNDRSGPDHPFSMNPDTWAAMVSDVRLLESAMGRHDKVVEENEMETVWIQRRCVRAAASLEAGDVLTRNKIEVLRPAVPGAVMPCDSDKILGMRVMRRIKKGDAITWDCFTEKECEVRQ